MAKPKTKGLRWKIVIAVFVFAIVLGGLLSAWLVIRSAQVPHGVARIYQDNELVHEVDLSTVQESYTFPVYGEHGEENIVLIEPGQISMQSSNCPDQVCVHSGAISSGLLPITCLPHRVVIQIEDAQE